MNNPYDITSTELQTIHKSLAVVQSEFNKLKKENPYLQGNLYVGLDYGNAHSESMVDNFVTMLQSSVNIAQSRKAALDKLTPQDMEILGLQYI